MKDPLGISPSIADLAKPSGVAGMATQATVMATPPPSIARTSQVSPAKRMYERLVKQIIEFEYGLSPEEELGGRFITAPRDGAIRIEDIGYWGPDMLIFYGRDGNGKGLQLLQHYSQLSVLLCAVTKVNKDAQRIGFRLGQTLKEKANEEE